MKTTIRRFPIRKLAYNLFAFLALTVLSVSCDSDENALELDSEPSASVYEIITYNSSKVTADRKGAPKKGDAPIAAIAINIDGEFNELVGALIYVDAELDAGLVNLFLNGTDQYTVFAPTDLAFNNLYATLGVDGIEDLDPELVLNVLLYHVTDGRRATNSVVPKKNTKTIETLLTDAKFSVDSTPMIMAIGNTANFVATDISASNGLIHVIDSVLLPIQL